MRHILCCIKKMLCMDNNQERELTKVALDNLMKDLNQIGNHLLRFYWYILVTISTLGVAYLTIIFRANSKIESEMSLILMTFICITGNMVLWLIAEYAISNGFLFRYVQVRIAEIEEKFITNRKLIKDPCSIENFYNKETNQLIIDKFLPDQFIPILKMSFLLQFLNTLFCIYNIYLKSSNEYLIFLCIMGALGSFLVIQLKINTYHIYKLNKFIKSFCEFKIISGKDNILLFNNTYVGREKNKFKICILSLVHKICFTLICIGIFFLEFIGIDFYSRYEKNTKVEIKNNEIRIQNLNLFKRMVLESLYII